MSFDFQQFPMQDDATEGGLMRAGLVRGEMILQAFHQGHVLSVTDAGSYATFRAGLMGENTRLQGRAINGTVPQGIEHYQQLTFVVSGTRFMLQFNPTTTDNLSVVIDGVCYDVDVEFTNWDSQVAATVILNGSYFYPIAEDLEEDIIHRVDVYIVGNADAVQVYELHGYHVDRAYGYREEVAHCAPQDPLTVPATITAPNLAGLGTYRTFSSVVAITYFNTDTELHTLTLARSADTTAKTVRTRVLAAGESWDFYLPMPMALDSNFYHKADVASKINYTVWGTW